MVSDAGTLAMAAPVRLRGVVIAGMVTVVVAFGGFFAWGFSAPLDSAAIASGVITVDSKRKTVQHLEGGILKALHVSDGDRVAQGQLLVEIDATASSATQEQIETEYWAAAARVERLKAERRGERQLEFSEAFRPGAENATVAEILETERSILVSRWETHDGRIAVNQARIAQMEEQIRAFKAQAEARRQQMVISRGELEKLEKLIERGYEATTRAVEERLRLAELTGEHAEFLARVAEARQAIKEAELTIANLKSDRITEIYAELEAAQRRAAEMSEKRGAAADVVRRTKVVAPQTGLVTDLRVYTIGGIIAPGQPILDIVPLNDELLVEAKVKPADIDSVRVGLDTHVRLTAFRFRTTPTVEGKVIHVSADKLADQLTGQPYFLVRVRLDPDALDRIEGIELNPGMPVEVLIITGARLAIDYFISPITDVMSRAMREK